MAEINALGQGKAVANYDSAVAGDKIIKQAIDTFGAIHVSPARSLLSLANADVAGCVHRS